MTGPDRTTGVLAAIDGALEDWTVSGDAMRWTPDPPTPLPIVWQPWDTPRVEALLAALGEAVEAVARGFADAIRAVGEALPKMDGALVRAGVHPVRPPVDPRARALWLRQHRGTGPDRQMQHRPRPRAAPGLTRYTGRGPRP